MIQPGQQKLELEIVPRRVTLILHTKLSQNAEKRTEQCEVIYLWFIVWADPDGTAMSGRPVEGMEQAP
jgi:hypothetical protein